MTTGQGGGTPTVPTTTGQNPAPAPTVSPTQTAQTNVQVNVAGATAAKSRKPKGPTMAEQLARIVEINSDEAHKRAEDRRVQIEHGMELREGIKTIREAIEKFAGNSVCKANCPPQAPANPAPNTPPPVPTKTPEQIAEAEKKDREAEALANKIKEERARERAPKKRNLTWLWILLGAIVSGVVVWAWMDSRNKKCEELVTATADAKAESDAKLAALLQGGNLVAPTTAPPAQTAPPVAVETPPQVEVKYESKVVNKELPPAQDNNFYRDRCPSGNCGDNKAYSPAPFDVEPEAFHRDSPDGPIGKWPYALVERESGDLNLLRYVDCVKAPDGCYVIQIRGGKYNDPDNAGFVRITYLKAPLPGVVDTDKVRQFGPLR